MYILWRKGIIKLFRLPYITHTYLISGMVECISVKLNRSSNCTLNSLIRGFLTCESYVFEENCR